MGRNNGTFKYKLSQDAQQDPDTGFYSQDGGAGDWLPGCECQIEKQIPAKQKSEQMGRCTLTTMMCLFQSISMVSWS